MPSADNILLGVSESGENTYIHPNMLNRHGLIAGATGTGKTVTLQVIAEQISLLGTPVFMTDIKGDLSGISKSINISEKISERLARFKDLSYQPQACPVNFIDNTGLRGHPLRVTPTSMGPLLLSRLLELNETQEGVLYIAFRYADEQGLLVLDLKDLKAILSQMLNHLDLIKKDYGNISPASIGAIQRRLLVLEDQGLSNFFGEPEFDIKDLLIRDFSGRGLVNILDAQELFKKPKLYASVLLWLLSEVFESLPEVGDEEMPRLVFFFDEAHLLFSDLSKALLDKIETIVRLIRSKGVGVFFITQNADDIPVSVLSQLGNKVQHALRAYTAKDAERIRKISRNFRLSEGLDIEKELTSLGVGEALASPLNGNGEPQKVSKILIRPPVSQIGPIEEGERKEFVSRSLLNAKYSKVIDRESAYEILKNKIKEQEELELENSNVEKRAEKKNKRQGPIEAFIVSIARSVGGQIGRQIVRGVLGGILRKK